MRLTRDERSAIVLDAAARLFYARGVHEVGMDELVGETGLGKATVYRLFPTKAELVGAYLHRLAEQIGTAIDDVARESADPADALDAVLDDIEAHLASPGFRGCPFNNASIEFDDPGHPARVEARAYRAELLDRLTALAVELDAAGGAELGARLAVVVDGAYTSAAHLGPAGPAAAGLRLARELVRQARPKRGTP